MNISRLRIKAAPRQQERAKPYYAWYVPYLFLLPGVALYLLWTIYPLIYQLYISFFDWKIMPGQTSTFVGIANYQAALVDRTFWRAMQNTFVYALVTVTGQMLIGLTLAFMVNRVIVGKRLFRTIYYLPVVTSWIVVSFLFIYLSALAVRVSSTSSSRRSASSTNRSHGWRTAIRPGSRFTAWASGKVWAGRW
jgi:ABC-type sugar transport system permease subunit